MGGFNLQIIHFLKDILPDLFKKIENRQKYSSRDNEGNIIKYVYKDGIHRVLQAKIDESLIKGMDDTENFIQETLKNAGKNEEEIQNDLMKFRETEIGRPIQLTKDIIIIKKNADLFHNFDEAVFLNHRFLVLLAYEYISLFLGSFIYDDSLNYIREFILDQQKTDLIIIEEYSTRKYAPIHRIYCENHQDKITINILLFGYIYYKINFIGFPYRFQESVILEDLEEKRAFAAESIEEAKKRNYKFEIKRMP